jgi:hypothetical protein
MSLCKFLISQKKIESYAHLETEQLSASKLKVVRMNEGTDLTTEAQNKFLLSDFP